MSHPRESTGIFRVATALVLAVPFSGDEGMVAGRERGEAMGADRMGVVGRARDATVELERRKMS